MQKKLYKNPKLLLLITSIALIFVSILLALEILGKANQEWTHLNSNGIALEYPTGWHVLGKSSGFDKTYIYINSGPIFQYYAKGSSNITVIISSFDNTSANKGDSEEPYVDYLLSSFGSLASDLILEAQDCSDLYTCYLLTGYHSGAEGFDGGYFLYKIYESDKYIVTIRTVGLSDPNDGFPVKNINVDQFFN